MILLVQLAVSLLYAWAFVARFWRRAEHAQRRNQALTAALLSSATPGVWAVFAAPLFPSYQSAFVSAGRDEMNIVAIVSITMIFAVFSLGPNLVGMAVLSTALAQNQGWLRACRMGGFIPIGLAHGLAVLLASLLPVSMIAVFGRDLGLLVSIVGSSFFYVTAALSGITAVGVYTLLDALAGRPEPSPRA